MHLVAFIIHEIVKCLLFFGPSNLCANCVFLFLTSHNAELHKATNLVYVNMSLHVQHYAKSVSGCHMFVIIALRYRFHEAHKLR